MKVAGKRSTKTASGTRKGSRSTWLHVSLDFDPASGTIRVQAPGIPEETVREAFRTWLGGSPTSRDVDRIQPKQSDVTVPLHFSLSPYNGDAFLTALRGGRTQEVFSRATGLPQSTISAIESGRRKLNLGHLGRIAEALGTSADAFLSGGTASRGRTESDAGYLARLLEELLRIQRLSHADFGTRIRSMLELDGKAMGVARVSYWRRSADKRSITCEAASFQDGRGATIEGTELNEANLAVYFKALARQEPIAATDALTDRRTSAFGPTYLKPAGIGAMLDVPVFVGGAFIGIICHEHVGGPREWRAEEQQFAVAVAGALAAAIEGERNSRIEAALRGT